MDWDTPVSGPAVMGWNVHDPTTPKLGLCVYDDGNFSTSTTGWRMKNLITLEEIWEKYEKEENNERR